MTTTVTTTIITSETKTISVRMGATLVLTARQGDNGEANYTLPGQHAMNDPIVPLAPRSYGPYEWNQDFEIQANGTVQADVVFTDSVTDSHFRYVASLPDFGQTGVIYCTLGSAFIWDGNIGNYYKLGSGGGGTTVFGPGSQAAPSVAIGEPDTGWYLEPDDSLGGSYKGVKTFEFGNGYGAIYGDFYVEAGGQFAVDDNGSAAQPAIGNTRSLTTGIYFPTNTSMGLCSEEQTLLHIGDGPKKGGEVIHLLNTVDGVNGFEFKGSATGGASAAIAASGTDANINMYLLAKGDGTVCFGEAGASVATPSTHKIRMRTEDGTVYYLLASNV